MSVLVLALARLVVRHQVVCLDYGDLGILALGIRLALVGTLALGIRPALVGTLDQEIHPVLEEILAQGILHPATVETLARGNLVLGSFDWVDYIPYILQVIEETIVVLLVVD